MLLVLIVLIAAIGLAGLALFARQIAIGRPWRPSVETLVLGAVTNFLDTLGIGSFAPTMAWFRFRRTVGDGQCRVAEHRPQRRRHGEDALATVLQRQSIRRCI